MADTSDYTGLITNEHSDKPKYMAMVGVVAQPLVDALNVSQGLSADFDLDLAIGAQLDQVGLWVGIGRRINTPLTGVYFSFDTEGLGFGQGVWKGPFDPDTGVIELDDETYRLLLRAKIAANHWDGTMETSKAILDAVFNPDGGSEFIEVTANNEMFALGDGGTTAFQLRYQGQAVYATTSMTIYQTDWQGLRQLYPTPRTNLITNSSNMSVAAWGKARLTVTPDAIAAPDGSMTANKLVPTAVFGNHVTSMNLVLSASTAYTFSFYAKAAEYSRVRIRGADNIGILSDVVIDLVTGSRVSGSLAVTIQALPDGWFFISLPVLTGVSTVSGSLGAWVYDVNTGSEFTGDGVSGLYVWGAQAELTPLEAASSYIPTSGVAVTVTDYTSPPFNIITLPSPLSLNASLSWSGQGTAYAAGTYAFIEDNQDMSMTIGIAGTIPSAIALALISGGYISLKPSGVQVNYYIATSVDNAPLFGFDIDNGVISGFDKGAWGTYL